MCWVHLSSFLPFVAYIPWWHAGGMCVEQCCARLGKIEQCWALALSCLLLPCFLIILIARRIRQRLHKKLGGVFSKKDFALAMERFKLLEQLGPALSQFGFRCEDLRASIQSIYPFQYTHTCIFIIYKYILVKGSLDVQTPWCRKYGQESRGQKRGEQSRSVEGAEMCEKSGDVKRVAMCENIRDVKRVAMCRE